MRQEGLHLPGRGEQHGRLCISPLCPVAGHESTMWDLGHVPLRMSVPSWCSIAEGGTR